MEAWWADICSLGRVVMGGGMGARKDASLSVPEAWATAGERGLVLPAGHYLDFELVLCPRMALLVCGVASRAFYLLGG